MEILNKKDYNETFTYEGPAQKGYVNFWTFKVGLLSDNTVINAINWVAEKVMYGYGLEPLYIKIYRMESTHMWLPAYDYKLEFVYHEKGLSLGKGEAIEKELALPVAILAAIATAISAIAIGVGVYIGAKGIRSIFYAQGDERSTFIDIAIAAIAIATAIGGGYLIYKKVIKKRRKKS